MATTKKISTPTKATPKVEQKPKTAIVRFAVAMNMDGSDWAICGVSGWSDEECKDTAENDVSRAVVTRFVELELPVPMSNTIKAKVI